MIKRGYIPPREQGQSPLGIGPWVSEIVSGNLSFLTSEMEVVKPSSKAAWANV